jgi:hypothetical protein
VQTQEQKTYSAGLVGHAESDSFGGYNITDGQYDQLFPSKIDLHDSPDTKLPIPPHFPFLYVSGVDVWWEVRFRYAEVATPVSVILQLDQYGEVKLDLTAVPAKLTDPSPDQVNAHPLSELASSMAMDNDKLKFDWNGTCGYRIEGGLRNKMIYMPYTLVNKNQLDGQNVHIKFPYAIYIQGGHLKYWDEDKLGAVNQTMGPGQTVHDLFLVDLLTNETDPMPIYLLRYNDDGSITTYQLDCNQPIATGTPSP